MEVKARKGRRPRASAGGYRIAIEVGGGTSDIMRLIVARQLGL